MRTVAVALSSLALLGAFDGGDAQPAVDRGALCSLRGGSRPSGVARIQDIVAQSQVIVRATALHEVPPGVVEFAVDEVLRGSGVPDTIRFLGTIRNDDAIPPKYVTKVPHHSYIRRYAGDCITMTYMAGGQYLLLLGHSESRGTLDPYWELLAPTNNQIGGADDPWVRWVRTELLRNPAPAAR